MHRLTKSGVRLLGGRRPLGPTRHIKNGGGAEKRILTKSFTRTQRGEGGSSSRLTKKRGSCSVISGDDNVPAVTRGRE